MLFDNFNVDRKYYRMIMRIVFKYRIFTKVSSLSNLLGGTPENDTLASCGKKTFR